MSNRCVEGIIRSEAGRLVAILFALLSGPPSGHAQSEPAATGGAAVEWIRPEEVPACADALLRRLEAVRSGAAAQAALDRIDEGLAEMGPNLDAALDRASAALARSTLPGEIDDVQRELTGAAAPLAGWQSELAAEAKRVADVLDEIAQAERVWSETRNRPETAAAGEVVERRVQSSLDALAEARARLQARRTRVLATSDLLVDRDAAVDAVLEKLQVAMVAEWANLFVPDRAPLWRSGFGAALRSELPRVPEEIRLYAGSTNQYVKQDARPLVVQALLAMLLMFAFRTLSARARARFAAEPGAARAVRLLERPYAIGLLLALLASPALHPLAPRRLMQLLTIVALFPTARIVIHASERANLTAFAGLFVVLFLDRIRFALAPLPVLARVMFLLTLAVALGLAFWFKRRVHLTSRTPWPERAAKLAILGLALALLAEVAGWTKLATLAGRAILASAISFLYIYAVVIVLSAALAYVLTSSTLRRSHLFERNTAVVQRRAERGLLWLGAGLWLYLLLIALNLRSTAAEVLRAVLRMGVSVGALSLSIGDVLAFVLTLLAAILLAWIVTRVLEEDVYPRTRLPRGVPYALSTLVRYAIYSLGFLFALATAGVQLSQVASCSAGSASASGSVYRTW